MLSNDKWAATPKWYWVFVGAALLWNLTGVWAFFNEVNLTSAEAVAAYGDRLGEAFIARQGMMKLAYALAVFGGSIGCLLLILRSKLAVWPFLISLLAILVRQTYNWIITGAMSDSSTTNQLLYISIPIFAVFLLWFTRRMVIRDILH